MINPYNVVNILVDLVSNSLTLNSTISTTQRDREVANMLFENVESILNSVCYSFENDFTWDSDNVAEVSDEMILSENDVNMKSNDNDDDDDDDDIDVDGGGSDKSDDDTFAFDENFSIENEKEDVIRNEFSIEYMTNVVNFFDEKDSTGKRKQSYTSVQRRFKRVKDRNYIRRFRIHIAKNGTKVRKLNLIDSFVYEAFNNARDKLLSVHDIDLKRWALKKAKDLFDSTFTVSDHWVRQFKIRHNIISRKMTKIVTKREIEDSDKIHQSADEFVSNM